MAIWSFKIAFTRRYGNETIGETMKKTRLD